MTTPKYTSRYHVVAHDMNGHVWSIDYTGTEQEARDYLHSRFNNIPTGVAIQVIDLDTPPMSDKDRWFMLRMHYRHAAAHSTGDVS